MVSLRRTKDAPATPGRRTATGRAPAKGRATGQAQGRAPRGAKVRQLKQAFDLTRQQDPRMPLLVGAALLVPLAVLLAVGFAVGSPIYLGILGLLVGLVAATAVFGRRVQGSAVRQIEGQPGAAAALVQSMRGDWRVTPAVGFTREQDVVHRVLGRPGVVLVGEGSPGRARGLIANEKKRLARFLGDVPVYDVLVGDGEGQVPLRGLQRHFLKLPRNLKPRDLNVLDRKLAAMAPSAPLPKGPVPTRVPRGRMR